MTKPRYLELEAYRGLAALAVVVYHAYQYTRLDGVYPYAGSAPDVVLHQLDGAVALFLALSGFLLYLPVARAGVDGQRGRRAADFLARRAVRILPLYVIAVTVVWAVRTPTFPGDWRDLVTHLTFTHVFFEEHIFSLIGPAWSLAVELSFYLLLALLLRPIGAAVARAADRGRRVAIVIGVPAALVAASVAFKLWAFVVAELPLDRFVVYFSAPAKLDQFALGMLLAAVLAARSDQLAATTAGRALAWRLVGVGVLIGASVARDPSTLWDLGFHTLVALGSVLLLAGTVLAPREGAWVRLLSTPALTWLGLWSYSIYIWHEPVLVWLGERVPLMAPGTTGFWWTVAVLVPASVVVGAALYWVIEVPAAELHHLRRDAQRDRYRPL